MKKGFAKLLAAIALLATTSASVGCIWLMLEEPKALKNMD